MRDPNGIAGSNPEPETPRSGAADVSLSDESPTGSLTWHHCCELNSVHSHFSHLLQDSPVAPYFVCLSLDSGHQLMTRRVVTIGLLDMALAHPREVFAGPIKDRAAAIIVAHNHPPGNVEPSIQDITTTQQLVAAGILLGVPVRDHIIVGRSKSFSFKRNHFI